MSRINIECFLSRLVTDADLRARVARSLKEACQSEGFALSPAEMSFLRHIDFPQFNLVAESIEKLIKGR
jgi:hypothetical protein